MTFVCLSPGSFCCRCCWFYQTRELSKNPHFSCIHKKNEKIANGWQSDDLDREDERLLSHQTLILVWELRLSGMRCSFYSTSKIALLGRESSSWEWRSRSSWQPTTATTSSSVRRVPRQAIFCRCDFPFSYIFRYGEKESREFWFWVLDLLLCFHLKIVDVSPPQAGCLLACCSALFAEKHSGV